MLSAIVFGIKWYRRQRYELIINHQNDIGSLMADLTSGLKKNVREITGTLDKLLQLRGIFFEWIDPAKNGNLRGCQIGMAAQDVEKVFPDWVGEDSDGYKYLSIRGFEALTVEGFRELRSE